MVKRKYDVEQENTKPGPSGEPTSDVYDNPTFNSDDNDKDQAEVDTSHVTAGNQSQLVDVKSQLTSMPMESGDKLKLAFLILFPLALFIVAVIITGLNT